MLKARSVCSFPPAMTGLLSCLLLSTSIGQSQTRRGPPCPIPPNAVTPAALNGDSHKFPGRKAIPGILAATVIKPTSSLHHFPDEELTHASSLVLNGGVRMPWVGIGTGLLINQGPMPVVHALRHGARLIDTGTLYRNEAIIRSAIDMAGVPRETLFIVSKAWPYRGGRPPSARPLNAPELVDQALKHITAMNVEYIDLYLLHHPTTLLVEQWQALVHLQNSGYVRAIGISNANETHIECLNPPPAVIQNELSPFDQNKLKINRKRFSDWCHERGIVMMSHSPFKGLQLGRAHKGNKKGSYISAEDWTRRESLIQTIAGWHNISPQAVLLRFLQQRGIAVIFGSSSETHIAENLASSRKITLNATEMARLCLASGHCSSEKQSLVIPPWRYVPREARSRSLRVTQEDFVVATIDNDCLRLWLDSESCDATQRSAPMWMASHNAPRLGSILAYRATDDFECLPHMGVSWRGPAKQRCIFDLGVLRPGGGSLYPWHGSKEVWQKMEQYTGLQEYGRIVGRLRGLFTADLTDPDRHSIRRDGAQYNHKQGLSWWLGMLGETFREFTSKYLLQMTGELVFGTNVPLTVLKCSFHRRIRSPDTAFRDTVKDAMLWHWDGLVPSGQIKMLVYLSNVTDHDGCMVAMRHKETGATVDMQFPRSSELHRAWGGPVSVPRPWIAELQDRGYRQECLSGGAGSIVIFDTNVVHRGGVPGTGRARDFILLQIRPCNARELARGQCREVLFDPSSRHYPANILT